MLCLGNVEDGAAAAAAAAGDAAASRMSWSSFGGRRAARESASSTALRQNERGKYRSIRVCGCNMKGWYLQPSPSGIVTMAPRVSSSLMTLQVLSMKLLLLPPPPLLLLFEDHLVVNPHIAA
jgi:hypothetical protein